MRTKDDPIDYKKDFFGLESYLCDSFGQLQGEAMSKIDSNWSKKLEVRSEKKKNSWENFSKKIYKKNKFFPLQI